MVEFEQFFFQVPAVHLVGDIMFFPNEFLLRRIPHLNKIVDKKQRQAVESSKEQYLTNCNQNLVRWEKIILCFFDNSFSNTFWYESAINWWRVIANTAVKRRACARRSILTGHALISRAKLQPRSRKLCTEILKRCKKFVQGNKNKAKDNSRLFLHKTHLITGFMFIYHCRFHDHLPLCFELHQKSYTVFKHRDLLVCLVVNNTCSTTWFEHHNSTRLSYKNSHMYRRLNVILLLLLLLNGLVTLQVLSYFPKVCWY